MLRGEPGPEAKVARARKHLIDLEAALLAYAASGPLKIVRERRGDEFVFRTEALRAPPPDLALIAGDVFHNARTALDHLAAVLVRQNGGSIYACQFPTAGRAEDLPGKISKNMGAASKRAQRFVQLLRPYRRTNGLAFLIHALDIADKHRLLVPFGTVNDHIKLFPKIAGPQTQIPFLQLSITQRDFLVDGSEFFRFPANVPDGIFDFQFRMEFRFAIDGQLLEESARVTAQRAVEYVDRVVSIAKRQFAF